MSDRRIDAAADVARVRALARRVVACLLRGDRAGYHPNNKQWLTITVGGAAPDATIRDLIEDSDGLVKRPRVVPGAG